MFCWTFFFQIKGHRIRIPNMDSDPASEMIYPSGSSTLLSDLLFDGCLMCGFFVIFLPESMTQCVGLCFGFTTFAPET
jgi:hypothetical protein